MKISVRKIVLALIAVLSIILGIVCFGLDTGSYPSTQTYGGDAYTGIQNAACKTAWNVKDLAKIVRFGFGSLLLIAGLTIGTIAVLPDKELKIEQKPKPAPVQPAYPPYGAAGAWQNPQPPMQPAWQAPQPSAPAPVPQPSEPIVPPAPQPMQPVSPLQEPPAEPAGETENEG